jgi:uncharacterized integral membrane protein (TIGR00698 family)
MSDEVFASLDSMEGIELPQAAPGRKRERVDTWSWAGLLAAAGVAAVAWAVHLLYAPLSAAILAIVLGALIRNVAPLPTTWIEASRGLVKRVIPITIVLTGASVSFTEVARVGAPSLAVIAAAIVCGCAAAALAGRMLRVPRNTALLVGCGTAICGTSAIIAAAPVIDAEDDDVLLSVSTINIMGLVVMFALPPLGAALHMATPAFGIWAGVTVHAVPQAITTGFAYSAQSGTLATLVKLVRVTLLAPFLVLLAVFAQRGRRTRPRYSALLPRFVWGFLALAALNTLHLLPGLTFQPIGSATTWRMPMNTALAELGNVLLTLSMAAMGLEVNLRFLLHAGASALVTGAVASVAQILLTLAMIHWLI